MATLTYAGPKRTFVRPSRNFDHLYDPNFYASSSRDHAKESFKAQTNVERIRYVPNFKTMFSSLRHYPSKRVTLDMTDPVPQHVSRQWKGYQDQAREAIIRYKKFTYDPHVQVPPKHFEPAYVRGKNRSLFFRRPIIPFLPQMPPNVVLAPTRMDPLEPLNIEGEIGKHLFDGPDTSSVLIQTDYRESEAQTDPYSPEYVIRPGSQPELLSLASLSYGHGLPAGLAEVEMIERARAKRAWEASLPPLTDSEQMEKRRKMMEEQERKEWAFREHEIEMLQEERIDVMKKMLQQREVDHHALNSKRMEHYWSKKQAEKERYMRRLHSKHVQALRRLTATSSNVEKKLERKTVIHQYSNFDSQVYAPMTRIGVYLDSNSEQYNVKSKFTTTLDGLMELEETLPLHVLHTNVKAPVRSASKAVGMQARRQLKLASILAEVHSEIIHNKTKGEKEEHPLRLLKRVEKPVPRPPTPCIPIPEANQEEKELALVLIQRVIRGRAIQTKMFEGKERRQQLIQELRTTHALQSPEQKVLKMEADSIRAKQADQHSNVHKENIVQDGSEQPVASHLGQRLDFLTKELVRLEEERRVAAYVMLAERERRIREAEESGKRQREERIRRTEDEMFKQMMRVHQGTVDTYLQDVILKSVDRTADEESRKEIAEKAKSINKLAQEFKYTELSAKELVAEMVHSFLLPEVAKRAARQKVQGNQRRHLLAAHRIILETIGNVSQNERGPSPPPPPAELGPIPSSLPDKASTSIDQKAHLPETGEEIATDQQDSLPEVRILTATTKVSEDETTIIKPEPLNGKTTKTAKATAQRRLVKYETSIDNDATDLQRSSLPFEDQTSTDQEGQSAEAATSEGVTPLPPAEKKENTSSQ